MITFQDVIYEINYSRITIIGTWGLLIGFIMIGVSPLIWNYNDLFTVIYFLTAFYLIVFSIGSKF